MASFNHQTQKPLSVLLAISLTFFLLLLSKVNSSEDLSFRYTNFEKNPENIILQGDAIVTSGKLQLTKVENGIPLPDSLGRALYATPVHVWDKSTGNVASFVTSFSFVIDSYGNTSKTADGLAFFIAPVDTQPGRDDGYLGLFNGQNYSSSYQIVAVEFDTYSNRRWDPEGRHIGIDVNTIKSKKTTSWGFKSGQVAVVVISYQASSKTLVAYLVYPSGKTSYIVSAAVDLKTIVPEWVRVGFSATTTTGDFPEYVETHDILSWSFKSKLPDGKTGAAEDELDLASSMLDDSMDLRTF